MQYLKFTGIMLFTLWRKVFAVVWFWVAAPFREFARNTVYNYKLQNNLWLKRLYERTPQNIQGGWSLTGGRTDEGFIKHRKISSLEYYLVYWLVWGWLDDDANHDVTDIGYIKTIISGERTHWLGSKFIPRLEKELSYLEKCKFGNTFELGDKRTPLELHKCWLSSLLWSCLRNGAYNFKYDQFETIDEGSIFKFKIGSVVIGWVPDDVVNGKQNYSLRFLE